MNGQSILRIEPVRAGRDDAPYECVAENGVGDAVSAEATLTIFEGKILLFFKDFCVFLSLFNACDCIDESIWLYSQAIAKIAIFSLYFTHLFHFIFDSKSKLNLYKYQKATFVADAYLHVEKSAPK